MATCKKCNQTIPYPTAHRKECGMAGISIKEPVIQQEDKLDKITQMLGLITERQQTLEKRLDKIEQPFFVNPPLKPKETVIKTLEANLEIAKSTQETTAVNETPKCCYGIHYPSDFGQVPSFDINGKPIIGKLSPAKRRCFPATGELRKLIDEILTSDFGADILPDPYSSTFEFTLIVPPQYCTVDDYRNGGLKDRRVKVINNFAAEQEVRSWCGKVKTKLYNEHMAAQLPSPFTVPSMKQTIPQEVVAPARENYTVTQIS